MLGIWRYSGKVDTMMLRIGAAENLVQTIGEFISTPQLVLRHELEVR